MTTTIRRYDWPDLDYCALAEVQNCHVTWRIIESDSSINLFWRKGTISLWEDPTEDPEEAEVIVTVDVKGDGCANYSWEPETCTHTCGRDAVRKLGDVLVRIHEETERLLTTWWTG